MAFNIGDKVQIVSLESIQDSLSVTLLMAEWHHNQAVLRIRKIGDRYATCVGPNGMEQYIPYGALRLVDERTEDERYLENLL